MPTSSFNWRDSFKAGVVIPADPLALTEKRRLDEAHVRAVGEIIPVVGFYLQPAIGGQSFPAEFWRAFVEIESVIGVKIAPFNRYATQDVLRGVAASGRVSEIAPYAGNDDHIVLDPEEDLSPGQAQDFDRVVAAYPHLIDDQFVQENLDLWLS